MDPCGDPFADCRQNRRRDLTVVGDLGRGKRALPCAISSDEARGGDTG